MCGTHSPSLAGIFNYEAKRRTLPTLSKCNNGHASHPYPAGSYKCLIRSITQTSRDAPQLLWERYAKYSTKMTWPFPPRPAFHGARDIYATSFSLPPPNIPPPHPTPPLELTALHFENETFISTIHFCGYWLLIWTVVPHQYHKSVQSMNARSLSPLSPNSGSNPIHLVRHCDRVDNTV
jgi:hypothetical protein